MNTNEYARRFQDHPSCGAFKNSTESRSVRSDSPRRHGQTDIRALLSRGIPTLKDGAVLPVQKNLRAVMYPIDMKLPIVAESHHLGVVG